MYGYTCETLRGNANGPLLVARVGSNWLQNVDLMIKVILIFSKL